ncbi:MAG: aminoacyl-tRNA hydrolase [Candidatus Omnitrophota bacterium]
MKLIIGLGNPGLGYFGSRHNIGFEVVKSLAKSAKIKLKKEKGVRALTGRGSLGSSEVLLALPLTFMNLSGEAAKILLDKYSIELIDLLAIFDDLGLEFGRIKVSATGSSAGHKGVESIINHLGAKGFNRLRIGIGRPQDKELSRFVLSKFNREEKLSIPKIKDIAVTCCKKWAEEGISAAMNNFNRKEKIKECCR